MIGAEKRILTPPKRSAKILRELVRGLVIACIASTAIAFAGPWYWFADLFSHFRVQYFVTLVLGAPILFWFGWRKTALIALIACAANAYAIFPHYQKTQLHTEARPDAPTVRFVSFNLLQRNKEQAETNGPEVSAFIRNCNADVIVFQELTPALTGVLEENVALYPHQFIRARKDSKGAALLTRQPAKNLRFEPFPGQDKIGAVATEFETGGRIVTAFGIHSLKPTKEKDAATQRAYFAWIAQRAREVRDQGHRFIVLGDFNATPWSTPFRLFAEESQLHDTSRGVVFGATWSFYLPTRLMIDHAFVSPEWRLKQRTIGPGLSSDHRPLILDLSLGAE